MEVSNKTAGIMYMIAIANAIAGWYYQAILMMGFILWGGLAIILTIMGK